ncbi:MAG: hypothetical protein MJ169_08385 [Treponema sp.]|nr:hypothetical protein [Treponema sp.]
MTDSEVNVISHLLEVEQNAESLVSDATAESSRRIIEAKSKADEEFNAKYTAMVNELDSSYNADIDSYQKKHTEELESYKTQVTSSTKDIQGFNKLLDSLL